MRISYYQKQIDTAVTQRTSELKNRKDGAPASAPSDSDTIRLNVSARAKELAISSSSVDESKVARLRSALESGTLEHDARSVARGIVQEQYGSQSSA